jgi:hypothetical protein
MITDPIKLTPTLVSILPEVGGGFHEETFRLKDLAPTGSVRIGDLSGSATLPEGWIKTLSLRQTPSNENSKAGLLTDRTAVSVRFSGPKAAGEAEAVGSVSVVISLPRGIDMVDVSTVYGCIAQLAQMLLTESDDPTANTVITCGNARLQRILTGEP